MSVELGDDDTYFVRGMGSISLWMPCSDVLELNNGMFSWVEEKYSFNILYGRSLVYGQV